MIIDAHQHFWKLSRGDYGWLTPAAGALHRDYLPEDLVPLLIHNGISGTVLVQAAPTEAETRFLFSLAQATDFVAGIVGWVDFEAPDAPERIATLVAEGKGMLKGLRPMIQDIADPRWLLRSSLDAAFEAMTVHGLVFDALVRPIHLGPLRERLEQHPQLRAVLDHAGKPDIAGGQLDRWAADIERLAHASGIHCKLSGLPTEAGKYQTADALVPYVSVIFDSFGPHRVLWGSDWPVHTTVTDYAGWLTLTRALIERVAPGRAADVLAGNARRIYGLQPP
jgi:L-fuconolactonase